MIAQLTPDYLRTRPLKAWSRLVSYALFEGRPVTTRGRWINPLVFAHLALEKRLPQLGRVKEPIFVLGTGRSGTTILGMVLSMHRDVGFLNEPKALWHSVYPHEDVVGNYSASEPRYALGEGEASEDVRRAAHRLFGAFLRFSGARRVLDKSEWMFRVPFLRAIFPDARFLFLIRDGWATASSIARWSERLGVQRGGRTHDWWGVDDRKWRVFCEQILVSHPDFAGEVDALRATTDHLQRAVVEWTVTMQEGLRLRRELPDAILDVRLEELTRQPAVQLPRIAEFCHLRHDPVLLEYAQRALRPSPTVEPFELPDALRAPFERTLRELGYE